MLEKLKAELNKLKGMTFKEKLDYIWEYYRIQIIIAVCVIALILSILNAFIFNPQKSIHTGMAFYGPFISQEILDNIELTMTTDLVSENENSKVYVTNFVMDEADMSYSYISVQKFVAMCSAQEIDIVISPKDQFIQNANRDYFVDLSTVEGIGFPLDEMLYTNMEDDPDTLYPFGIPLKGSAFLKEMGLITDNLYLGIFISTPRLEESIEAVNYILSGGSQ